MGTSSHSPALCTAESDPRLGPPRGAAACARFPPARAKMRPTRKARVTPASGGRNRTYFYSEKKRDIEGKTAVQREGRWEAWGARREGRRQREEERGPGLAEGRGGSP